MIVFAVASPRRDGVRSLLRNPCGWQKPSIGDGVAHPLTKAVDGEGFAVRATTPAAVTSAISMCSGAASATVLD
jgi:hypothetical protein